MRALNSGITMNLYIYYVLCDTKTFDIMKHLSTSVFKASTGVLFKSAEKFSGCLRVLIHCLIPTFREHYSLLH